MSYLHIISKNNSQTDHFFVCGKKQVVKGLLLILTLDNTIATVSGHFDKISLSSQCESAL